MKLEDIPAAIANDLAEYTEDKCGKIDKAVRNRTEQALTDVTAAAPVRQKKYTPKSGIIKTHGIIKENYQPGAYKKGFIKYISTKREGRTQGYVRNKTNPQLVHLLELGHRARDGSMVSPIKHIVPAEEKARADLAKDIEKILEE